GAVASGGVDTLTAPAATEPAELRHLLLELGGALTMTGDAVSEIEAQLRSIAAAYGFPEARISVFPTLLMVGLGAGGGGGGGGQAGRVACASSTASASCGWIRRRPSSGSPSRSPAPRSTRPRRARRWRVSSPARRASGSSRASPRTAC